MTAMHRRATNLQNFARTRRGELKLQRNSSVRLTCGTGALVVVFADLAAAAAVVARAGVARVVVALAVLAGVSLVALAPENEDHTSMTWNSYFASFPTNSQSLSQKCQEKRESHGFFFRT